MARHLIRGLALLLLVFAAHAPALWVPDWSGTEGRRVQIAVEITDPRAPAPGLVPTLGLEPTWAKPPLAYWALAGWRALFGEGKAVTRAMSLAALWLLVWLVWSVLDRRHGPVVAWIAAAGITTSIGLLDSVPRAEIDPLFACATAASVLLLGDACRRDGQVDRGRLVASGLLAGVAMLAKAFPFFLFAAGGVWIAVRRGGLRPVGLLLWLALAVGPFVVWGALALAAAPPAPLPSPAVTALATSDETFAAYLWRETVGRITRWDLDAFGDLLEFVGLVLGCWLAFWPFVLAGRRSAPPPTTTAGRLWAAAALVAVGLLALFPHRPIRYLLPAIPLGIVAFAPAVGRFLRGGAALPGAVRTGLRVVALLGAAVVVGAAAVAHPAVARLPILCALLALLPWIARTRGAFLVCVLGVVPVVASWTVLHDVLMARAVGVRSSEAVARPLARSLSAGERGSLGTHFHPPCQLFLELGVTPTGGDEESATGRPREPLLLVEEPYGVPPPNFLDAVAGYDVRLRVMGKSRMYVLRVRR